MRHIQIVAQAHYQIYCFPDTSLKAFAVGSKNVTLYSCSLNTKFCIMTRLYCFIVLFVGHTTPGFASLWSILGGLCFSLPPVAPLVEEVALYGAPQESIALDMLCSKEACRFLYRKEEFLGVYSTPRGSAKELIQADQGFLLPSSSAWQDGFLLKRKGNYTHYFRAKNRSVLAAWQWPNDPFLFDEIIPLFAQNEKLFYKARWSGSEHHTNEGVFLGQSSYLDPEVRGVLLEGWGKLTKCIEEKNKEQMICIGEKDGGGILAALFDISSLQPLQSSYSFLGAELVAFDLHLSHNLSILLLHVEEEAYFTLLPSNEEETTSAYRLPYGVLPYYWLPSTHPSLFYVTGQVNGSFFIGEADLSLLQTRLWHTDHHWMPLAIGQLNNTLYVMLQGRQRARWLWWPLNETIPSSCHDFVLFTYPLTREIVDWKSSNLSFFPINVTCLATNKPWKAKNTEEGWGNDLCGSKQYINFWERNRESIQIDIILIIIIFTYLCEVETCRCHGWQEEYDDEEDLIWEKEKEQEIKEDEELSVTEVSVQPFAGEYSKSISSQRRKEDESSEW